MGRFELLFFLAILASYMGIGCTDKYVLCLELRFLLDTDLSLSAFSILISPSYVIKFNISFTPLRRSICTDQGTQSLTNPPTSRRQVTQLPKLFIAKLTLQSSQTQRQRHGQAIIVRGED